MGDNGFHEFAKATFLPTFGNPNASAPAVAEHTSQPVTESAATGASELHVGPCQYVTCMHLPGEAGCAKRQPCQHQWLRPDNGKIECNVCGTTRNHYGDDR